MDIRWKETLVLGFKIFGLSVIVGPLVAIILFFASFGLYQLIDSFEVTSTEQAPKVPNWEERSLEKPEYEIEKTVLTLPSYTGKEGLLVFNNNNFEVIFSVKELIKQRELFFSKGIGSRLARYRALENQILNEWESSQNRIELDKKGTRYTSVGLDYDLEQLLNKGKFSLKNISTQKFLQTAIKKEKNSDCHSIIRYQTPNGDEFFSRYRSTCFF